MHNLGVIARWVFVIRPISVWFGLAIQLGFFLEPKWVSPGFWPIPGFDLTVGQASFLSDPLKNCFPVWLEKRLTGCLRLFPEIIQQELCRVFRSLTVYLGVQEVCQLVTLPSDIFFDILHGVHDAFYCRMSVHTIIFEFQLLWLNFLPFTFSTFALSRCFHGSWWSCILWPFVPLSIPPVMESFRHQVKNHSETTSALI